jgi:polysaccharide chain length determinant protein (PEP-CTERM system associated)
VKDAAAYLWTEIQGALRFKWIALAVAFVVCVIGWAMALSAPDIYEARARVYVDTSSRLRDVLGRIAFEPDVDSRVALVRQAMLGRPQLERVANETDLDLRAAGPEELEELIDGLLLKISITATRTQPNLYTITYQDNDHAMAVSVVDTLLNAFVEDVIEQKERGSRAAENFLSEQITHYADQLAEEEQRLAEFKKRNIGLMPGESGDYFQRLQRETELVDQLTANLQIARSRRAELRRQLSGENPLSPPSDTPLASGSTLPEDSSTLRIRELEATLSEYLLRFTDRHPDVVAVREQIAQLRAQREREMAALSSGAQNDATLATNPVFQSMKIALNDADVQIAALVGELDERTRRMTELKALLDTAPEIEAELARLTRNYGNTRALYDQLLTQLESERLVNEGDEQNVINFETIDPPQASSVPVGPKRGLLLIATMALAVGLGGAVAYVLNQLKPVFFNSVTLRTISGLPVLGEVSRTARDVPAYASFERWGFAAVSLSLLVAFAVVLVFSQASASVFQGFVESIVKG